MEVRLLFDGYCIITDFDRKAHDPPLQAQKTEQEKWTSRPMMENEAWGGRPVVLFREKA